MVSCFSIKLTALSGAVLALCTFGLPAAGILYFLELKLALLAQALGLISVTTERVIEGELLLWTAVIATPVLGWLCFLVFERILTVEIDLMTSAEDEIPFSLDSDGTSPA